MFEPRDKPARPSWMIPIDGGIRRLHGRDVADLTWFWHDYAPEIGLRAAGLEYSTSSSHGSYSHPLAEQEAIIAIGKARVTWAALSKMPDLHRTVLYRVYGDRTPWGEWGAFGDVAQIVTYTDFAKGLAEDNGTTPRQAILSGLRGPTSAAFIAKARQAAERLLCQASESYRTAKGPFPCASPQN